MPYEPPRTLLSDSPPHGAGASSDIEDPSGLVPLSSPAAHPDLDPYAPYSSSSSDEISDREGEGELGGMEDGDVAEVNGDGSGSGQGEGDESPATMDDLPASPIQDGSLNGRNNISTSPTAALLISTQLNTPLAAAEITARRKRSSSSAAATVQGSDSGQSSGTATVVSTATVNTAGTSSKTSSPVNHTIPLSATLLQPSSAQIPQTIADAAAGSLPVLPRMTRASSMPGPQQLRHLQHPLGRVLSGTVGYGAAYSLGAEGYTSTITTTTTTTTSDSPTALLSASTTLSSLPTSPRTAMSADPYFPSPSSPLSQKPAQTASSASSALEPPSVQPTQAEAQAQPQPHTAEYLRALSLEIADSVQSITQTLVHLTPPNILNVLDPPPATAGGKEQSAQNCMVPIPAGSILGLLGAMRRLGDLSATLAAVAAEPLSAVPDLPSTSSAPAAPLAPAPAADTKPPALNTKPPPPPTPSPSASTTDDPTSSVHRQIPPGMIFSPTQIIDSYHSPGAEGPPHLHLPSSISSISSSSNSTRPMRRQLKRVTTAETRPFLLPGRDEESGDAGAGGAGGAGGRYRARRSASGGATGSLSAISAAAAAGGGGGVGASGIPLPPSRPGSTRAPSGGSTTSTTSAPTGTASHIIISGGGPGPGPANRLTGRRTSGQIISAGSMNFSPGETATPSSELPGAGFIAGAGAGAGAGQVSPSAERRPIDPDKQTQRENIRKLIQAGVEAVAPASSLSSALRSETTAGSTASAGEPAPVIPAGGGGPTIPSINLTPSVPVGHKAPSPVPVPISPPATHPHVPPVTHHAQPPAVSAWRRSSEATITSPGGTKKSVGDNTIVPPINVLIAEDNPINQTILMTFMRRKKIKYGTANDGAQAVEKWKTGGYHLILMDIQMPVMDGIEATKEIRRLEYLANVGSYPTTPPGGDPSSRAASPSLLGKPPGTPGSMPQSSPHRSSVIIVALTASSLQSDRLAALAAGCNDFLTKPVSLKWLEKKIIEWGSIKALQMWADSAVTRGFSSGQAARGAKIRDQLRINRSGRNSPSPGPPAKNRESSTERERDTPTPRVTRPAPGPVPLLAQGTKETLSASPLTQPSTAEGTALGTVDDRRAQSAESISPYFPNPPPDVFAPNEAKSLLLQDVLDDEDEDSPAETIREISPRPKSVETSPSPEAH